MTATQLSLIVGAFLSLVFTFIPGVRPWYANLEATWKAAIMALMLLLTTAAIFGLSCIPSSPYQYFTCDVDGFWQALALFVTALIANQGTYLLTSPFKAVKKMQG